MTGEFKWATWPPLPWPLLVIMAGLVLASAVFLAGNDATNAVPESDDISRQRREPMPVYPVGDKLDRIEATLVEIQDTLEEMKRGPAYHAPATDKQPTGDGSDTQ